jgi:hypothetical protein
MELTPLAGGRRQPELNRRSLLQSAIVAALGVAGIQIRERVFRGVETAALNHLYTNLQAAANQGAVRLAEIYRDITGHQVDNFEQLLGMSRRHKWGENTQPPTFFTSEDQLRKRIANLKKNVDAYKLSHPRNVDAIADREHELQRWQTYLTDQFGPDQRQDTPAADANDHPNALEGDSPRGEIRPASAEPEDRNVRPRPDDDIDIDWGDNNQLGDLDEFSFDSQELQRALQGDPAAAMAPVNNAPRNNMEAGISGGGSAMQMACGRIGKNKPIRSKNGEHVCFSGSRAMYTWGYNFSEQVNPFSAKRELSYNTPGSQLCKPIGHTLPWDIIGFYCTPAEWESLLWKTHKIEIESVEVSIIPIDKTVFFTTGSTDSKPVSTEHSAYIYKVDSLPPNCATLRCQPKSGAIDLNWTTDTLLAPTDYKRLRDRLWGPSTRAKTGHSCADGIKRELETLSCLLLDNPTVFSDYGSFLLGEYQDVYPLEEVFQQAKMGIPFITKKYKPVCGLVNDPSCKTVMNRFDDVDTTTGNYFIQKKFCEDMLHEAAILAHKDHSYTFLKYKEQNGALRVQDSASFPIHGGPKTATLNNHKLMAYPGTAAANSICTGALTANVQNRYQNVGVLNTYETQLGNGDADGQQVNGYSAALVSTKVDANTKGLQWAELYLKEKGVTLDYPIPTGAAIMTGSVDGKPQIGKTAFQSTSTVQSTYTNWTQSLTLDKDYGVNYGDSGTFYLQQWHSNIEKANSFIKMKADRDNFPQVVPEQPVFAFGVKPVIATDPNVGDVDFLKAHCNWKISYKMNIKQTYVPPELRFVEKRSYKAANDTRPGPYVLPDVSDYSSHVRPAGLQISIAAEGTYKDGTTTKTVKFDTSEQNPLERDLLYNGRVFQSIRTAPVYHPQDSVVFPSSVQTDMCNTPMVLNETKIV